MTWSDVPRKTRVWEKAFLRGEQEVYLRQKNGPGREGKGVILEYPSPVNRSQDHELSFHVSLGEDHSAAGELMSPAKTMIT